VANLGAAVGKAFLREEGNEGMGLAHAAFWPCPGWSLMWKRERGGVPKEGVRKEVQKSEGTKKPSEWRWR